MAAVERLMGVGLNSEVAKRTGFFVQTVEGATLQGPGNYIIRASNSATINLASNFDLGDMVIVCAQTTVSVAPDSASAIWPTSAGVAHQVTSGVAKTFLRVAASAWFVMSSA